jgi:uncharacterized protein involved in exopolysaccharide biosynthesis
MDFNPKEIQKFYDIWSPMLEALPAVIAAAERGDELKRHTAILTKDLQDVQKQIADEKAKVGPVRKETQDAIEALVKQKIEAERGYNQYLSDAKAHLAEIDTQTDAEVAAIKAKVGEAQAELAQATQEITKAKAQADAEISQKKATAEAELADIEAKKQVVERALASLKAKIG